MALFRPFHVSPAFRRWQWCQQIYRQSKSCPHWQQCPSHQMSLFMASHPLTQGLLWLWTCCFPTCYACVYESVRQREHVHVGVAWCALGLSYQDNGKSMRTSFPHKAISLSTPAVMGVCVYVCMHVYVMGLPLSTGCDFYTGMLRKSTDH